ncbi:hypothetical protein DXG01_007080 [Tephrocybe rancida]|nr:hypothetical protein DXG01_007080 [Tephrocybe rancida]
MTKSWNSSETSAFALHQRRRSEQRGFICENHQGRFQCSDLACEPPVLTETRAGDGVGHAMPVPIIAPHYPGPYHTSSVKPMDDKTNEKGLRNPSLNTNSDPESLDTAGRLEDEKSPDDISGEGKLVRQLKNRHITMISIGGVIGTGAPGVVFEEEVDADVHGRFISGDCVVFEEWWSGRVMISLGEMVAYLPIPGGHIKLAERFVNPAFSFTLGWNFWYNWTIVLPAELTAAAVLIGFWSDVDPAVWITMTMVITIGVNMFGAGVYGEAEFVFASIKVITIVGLIILGIVLDLGGGPNHDRIGFRYWKNPGAFAQFDGIPGAKGRFLAWWAVMTQAAFSFVGTEVVAIAAGEAKNPSRNLPKAIRTVYISMSAFKMSMQRSLQGSAGIVLFYVGGTAIIGLLVPYTSQGLDLSDGTAASSPFVIAIQNAGIKVLPSIINACLLTSAWSAACSDLYISSRALCMNIFYMSYFPSIDMRTPDGLALAGNAPKVFLTTSKKGLPYVAITFCAAFALLAYMGINKNTGKVFQWFANMIAVASLLTWFGISLTYLRFYKGMKVQGFDRRKLPFASRLQPYAAWYAMLFCVLICFTSGWKVFLKGRWATDTFVTNYLPLVGFPIIYVGAKLVTKKPIVRAHEMDFVTDIKEIEADT